MSEDEDDEDDDEDDDVVDDDEDDVLGVVDFSDEAEAGEVDFLLSERLSVR